jgi:TPR repeat protein
MEACGHAGMMHLLGIGDLSISKATAYTYFSAGAPAGLECKEKECDALSLDGLGLCFLWGVKDEAGQDIVVVKQQTALKYFEKAYKAGLGDGLYHVALLRTGWQRPVLANDGSWAYPIDGTLPENRGYPPPTLSEYEMGFKEFEYAARMGHAYSMYKAGVMLSHG